MSEPLDAAGDVDHDEVAGAAAGLGDPERAVLVAGVPLGAVSTAFIEAGAEVSVAWDPESRLIWPNLAVIVGFSNFFQVGIVTSGEGGFSIGATGSEAVGRQKRDSIGTERIV